MEHKYKYYKDYEKERDIVINELLRVAEIYRAKGYSEDYINQHYEQVLSNFDARAPEMDRRYKAAWGKYQSSIKASKKEVGISRNEIPAEIASIASVLIFRQKIVILMLLLLIIVSAK